MALDSYLALDGFTQGTSGPGTLSPVSHPTPSSSRGNNPLTTKLSTVLSTSYSDADFREALALLDERGVGNDARTRRRIRLDVHKEVISSNSLIVDEFGRVADQLRQIRTTLGKLNAGYDKMKNEVLDAHKETSPAMLESASLLEQREQVETKQRVLATFKDHFLMSDDEVASLTSTAEPVDDRFFDALSKAKSISQNCEILLGFERQTLGSDLMEQSSKNINFGFQKLYKWVQREFKTLNLENPQMNTSIRRALRVLAGRPSLFQNCLDFFAEARDRILSDSFQVALTGTNASGAEEPSIKPIDLTAHDPLRYVGDMLAWVHSATVSEREALEVLFVAEGDELAEGLRSGRDAEIWRLVIEDDDENQDDFNALKALGDLVDRNVAGAARALRQRVEQVIRSNEETITAYKLAMLIKFYRITFHKLLGPKAGLVDCAASLEEEALRQYRSLVRDHIAALQGEFQHAPPDLGPPAFLSDALRQLGTIMKTYESSLSAAEDRESDFKDVLAEAFEPFLAGCENMARPLQAPGDAIFLINCRRAAIKCLEVFDFTKQRATRLRQSIEHELEDLVGDQHLFFCTSSGLGPLLGSRGEGRFESGAKHLTKDALARASQQLDDFLPSAMMDAMERLKRLQDTTLARHATEEAASRFCRDFRDLELEIEKIDDRDVSQGADELGLRHCDRAGPGTSTRYTTRVGTSTHVGVDVRATSCAKTRTPQPLVPGCPRPVLGQRITTTTHDPTHGYESAVKAMLRNKAFTVLQKTYDDSYLSCSTAVYYESQGDEIEAMRHWRSALEQIYEHRAKAAPGYGPQTDTERALVDALRELELQCKERIDLLEALRASRSEGASPSPGTRLSKTPPEPYRPVDRTKGSIGQGTIPAVTYSELSRPSIPSRPSLPARTSSEVGLSASVGARLGPSSSNNDLHRTNSPKLPPRPDKAVRSPSPEKHTMRTTLRSGRMGEKPQKTARISPKPIAEGPSKAATLAWTALGSRERALKPSSDGATASQFLSPRKSSDGLPRPGPSQNFQWDSHSRRLVTPRDPDHFSNGSQAIGTPRHSDEYSRGRPSLLSLRQGNPKGVTDPAAPGCGRLGESDKRDTSETRARGKAIARRPVKPPQPRTNNEDRARRRQPPKNRHASISSTSNDELEAAVTQARTAERNAAGAKLLPRDTSSDRESGNESSTDSAWKRRKAAILKNLPPGVDEAAAKQILNDIIVHGDERPWSTPFEARPIHGASRAGSWNAALWAAWHREDDAGSCSSHRVEVDILLYICKQPHKQVLGRVRETCPSPFGLARALAPSIIFVDEIDSLLSQRSGSGEHEATRRIKTEFLIQWSDLQRAAAGRETTERDKQRGDANRVLVLAATNLPWAIDEAARRRFVRRQYIPLPEPHTRETQLRTLLGQQKHSLSSADIKELVQLTEGFSGSDITALAKDAAMGPLRSLGEALLHMTMDQIRPIMLDDFKASLGTIRPSVGKAGLKEYEDWAREFGERGG
ncbi:hypothetical protein ACCO45_014060 [Purpureocillium lilacinum]|uniref:Uncharacterized protein n=1 Tax=Purpureocillium lilacinum TaxID=33203 RepID=A0ACC4DAP0_PURLI